MEAFSRTLIRAEFTRKAELSLDLRLRLALEAFEAREREAKEKKEERERDEEVIQLMHVVLASSDDIASFEAKLDHYDEATTKALMENEIELKAVRERINKMMLEAHVLPDGRRVFKTEDGTRVFDENGTEIKADQIDPAEIDDGKPTWEVYNAAREEKLQLERERTQLHEYQDKLDSARERLDDPKLSKDELEALDKELGEAMPDRVKADLGMSKPASDSAMKVDAEPAPASTERRVQSHLQPAI